MRRLTGEQLRRQSSEDGRRGWREEGRKTSSVADGVNKARRGNNCSSGRCRWTTVCSNGGRRGTGAAAARWVRRDVGD